MKRLRHYAWLFRHKPKAWRDHLERLVMDLAIAMAVRPWGRSARAWIGGHWHPWVLFTTTVWHRAPRCMENGPDCEDHGEAKRRWRW